MKKILTLLVCAIAAMSFAKLPEQETKKEMAAVQQIEGLYVFLQCKPVAANEYLGSVKKSLAWSGKPEEMLNSMIKKVKKDYPKADGIVFTNIDMDKADAIQFK